jgi:hypothetical protein
MNLGEARQHHKRDSNTDAPGRSQNDWLRADLRTNYGGLLVATSPRPVWRRRLQE